MSNRKLHGERNRTLSYELFRGRVYYDWVITTAFYSVIHIVEDTLLPCELASKMCRNIYEVKKAYRMNGRHSSRERLVFDKLPIAVAVKYKWLDDKSRYSRYTTYKVTVTEADKALQYLEAIYQECYKS